MLAKKKTKQTETHGKLKQTEMVRYEINTYLCHLIIGIV